MKTIINHNTNPAYNLALEEYLLKYKALDEDLFYLWRNEPSIIVGRNQNPFYEVHLKQLYRYKIPLIRRTSGGGTVYHDLGNINFTYITSDLSKTNDYLHFLNPIISALNHLGLTVKFVPKTHLYQNEYKLSGNAQSVHKGRLIHHGTLLYDTNQKRLRQLLKSPLKSKNSIASTPAITKNIKDFLFIESTIESFMDYITESLFLGEIKQSILSLKEKDQFIITQLKKVKYETYDWNFGANATFKTIKVVNHSRLTFHIKKGRIHDITGKNRRLSFKLKDVLFNTPLNEKELKRKINDLSLVVDHPHKLIEKLAFYP